MFYYGEILTVKCVLCQETPHVVRNSCPDALVVNINCDVFSKFISILITKDINNCEQLLGQVCIELADYRQALNAILSGISQELLNDDEVELMIKFKNFIMKYTGVDGECWAFNPALNRGFRAAHSICLSMEF